MSEQGSLIISLNNELVQTRKDFYKDFNERLGVAEKSTMSLDTQINLLNKSIASLQISINKQNESLADIVSTRSVHPVVNMDDLDMKLEAMEKRTNLLIDDIEEKCITRKRESILYTNKCWRN